MPSKPTSSRITRARELRAQQTRSEGLLWSILRARQLCGLKFRRQHPIGPWIADFACTEKNLVVEIDGGYHEQTSEEDLRRQEDLQRRGWQVIRFTAEEVEQDAEAIGRAIAQQLELTSVFDRRKATGSGMKKREVRMPR